MQKISKALDKFRQICPTIPKNATANVRTKTGQGYKFHYADLETIVKTIKEPMLQCELTWIQTVHCKGIDRVLETHLVGHGESISSTYPLPQTDNPQEFGSALTYAKRYSLTTALGVIAEDDEDGNIAAGNEATISKPNSSARQVQQAVQQIAQPRQGPDLVDPQAYQQPAQPAFIQQIAERRVTNAPSQTKPTAQRTKDSISDKQCKRLFAISKSCNWSWDDVTRYVAEHYHAEPETMHWKDYNELVDVIEGKQQARQVVQQAPMYDAPPPTDDDLPNFADNLEPPF